MIIRNAQVFTLAQGFVEKEVVIRKGYFVEPSEGFWQDPDEVVIDAAGAYLIPGLVDVHFHGCAGYDFSDGTMEALTEISAYELANGITSICPASMTLPEEELAAICKNAYAYTEHQKREAEKGMEKPSGSRLCGIHLEGPFIAEEKKGAQNPAYIQKPDVELFQRLQEAAHGLVKLITLAPEVEGAERFIRELGEKVHISLGHTCCYYKTASQAFSLGADHVTHFYNAMRCLVPREPGLFGAAFDAKHVMIELICDGVHIAPPAMRIAFQLFGKERVVLISDSMMATGMEDGTYTLGGLPVTVKGNRAVLSDDTIAGSATNLMDCMRQAVAMGIPLEDAVRCASYNPAKSIGIENVCGSIEPGKYGDCVLLSQKDLSVQQVILGGEFAKNFLAGQAVR